MLTEPRRRACGPPAEAWHRRTSSRPLARESSRWDRRRRPRSRRRCRPRSRRGRPRSGRETATFSVLSWATKASLKPAVTYSGNSSERKRKSKARQVPVAGPRSILTTCWSWTVRDRRAVVAPGVAGAGVVVGVVGQAGVAGGEDAEGAARGREARHRGVADAGRAQVGLTVVVDQQAGRGDRHRGHGRGKRRAVLAGDDGGTRRRGRDQAEDGRSGHRQPDRASPEAWSECEHDSPSWWLPGGTSRT